VACLLSWRAEHLHHGGAGHRSPDDSRVLGGCEISPSNKINGTFYWDLISRNGQNVVSGIYLYAIDTGKEICRGRFVIIR
jgi:hypothetical protein